MRRLSALVFVLAACFCLTVQVDAAQKKKPTTPPAKSKINYYELCKKFVAKDKGAHVRVQRYRLSKDGTLHCWYYA
jgi:hypothetical protein